MVPLLIVLHFVVSTVSANLAAEMANAFANAMKDVGNGNDEASVRVIGSERPIIEWDESDQSTPTVNAGIVTTLSASFFEDYNSLVMDLASEEIRNLSLENYCTDMQIATALINLCVSNQRTLSYSIDKSRSKLQIHSEKDALKLSVSGINMNFAFDYKVWSEPDGWFKDQGSGDIMMMNSDMSL